MSVEREVGVEGIEIVAGEIEKVEMSLTYPFKNYAELIVEYELSLKPTNPFSSLIIRT